MLFGLKEKFAIVTASAEPFGPVSSVTGGSVGGDVGSLAAGTVTPGAVGCVTVAPPSPYPPSSPHAASALTASSSAAAAIIHRFG